MVPLVFKTSGPRAARPAGSIPVRLRYLSERGNRTVRRGLAEGPPLAVPRADGNI